MALHKTSRSPSALVLILRGVAQGATTARMARELGCDRLSIPPLKRSSRFLRVLGNIANEGSLVLGLQMVTLHLRQEEPSSHDTSAPA
jgi:hypothetical protein